jgi:hypothetical protein
MGRRTQTQFSIKDPEENHVASTEEYIATSITTRISGAEPHRTGLAGIEKSIFRESLLRAYLGVLLRGLECVYFCGRCGTKIMQQRVGKYHVLILIICITPNKRSKNWPK